MAKNQLLLKEFLPALAAVARPAVAAVAPQLAGIAIDKVADKLGEEKEEVKKEGDVYEALSSMMETELEKEGILGSLAGTAAGTLTPVPGGATVGGLVGDALQDKLTDESKDEELEEDGYPYEFQYPSSEKPAYPRFKTSKEGMKVQDDASLKRDASGVKSEDGYPRSIQYPGEKPVYPRVVEVKKGNMKESFLVMPINEQLPGVGSALKQMVPKLMQMLASMDPNTLQQILGLLPKLISMKAQRSMGESESMSEATPEEVEKELQGFKSLAGSKPAPTSPKKVEKELQGFRSLRREGVVKQKKALVDKLVKEQINEQIKVRALTERLLKEGPLSAVWQGVKDVGRGVVGGAKAAAQGAQQAIAQGAVQDQAKQSQKAVMQAMKTVEKARGKFNQETMKSADLVAQYHDAVVNLVNVHSSVGGQLGPMEMNQLKNDVNQSVGQLWNDLHTEKQGIEGFLRSLQKTVPTSFAAGTRAKQAEKDSADKTRAETPAPSKAAQASVSPGMRRLGKK